MLLDIHTLINSSWIKHKTPHDGTQSSATKHSKKPKTNKKVSIFPIEKVDKTHCFSKSLTQPENQPDKVTVNSDHVIEQPVEELGSMSSNVLAEESVDEPVKQTKEDIKLDVTIICNPIMVGNKKGYLCTVCE